MQANRLSVYAAPSWGAKCIGEALASKDERGELFIDGVHVVSVEPVSLFSVLHRVDGQTQIVLTSFLRLVPDPRFPARPLGYAEQE